MYRVGCSDLFVASADLESGVRPEFLLPSGVSQSLLGFGRNRSVLEVVISHVQIAPGSGRRVSLVWKTEGGGIMEVAMRAVRRDRSFRLLQRPWYLLIA